MKNIMLRTIAIAFLLTALISCKKNQETKVKEVVRTTTNADDYELNVENSRILWKGKKTTGTHNGTIMFKSGNLSANGDKIEAGTFVINMNTITATDLEGAAKTNLENHLKGTVEGKEVDFFDVTKYPTAIFEITGFEFKENGKAKIGGNLTIKGKKNYVAFSAITVIGENSLKLVSEPFMIDRTKWGVNYGSKSVFDIKDKFVNDEVEITIELNAKKNKV